MSRPYMAPCHPANNECGAVLRDGDAVTVGSTVNLQRATVGKEQFLSLLASEGNPFSFLTSAEWADMRSYGPRAFEIAWSSPGRWVIATAAGIARHELLGVTAG